MNCGTVIHDKEFQFPDGQIGNKLIIILSEYGTNYLVVKTTSKQHRKNINKGCQIKDIPPNYFVPKNHQWFNSNTWIELDEVIEYDETIFSFKKQDRIAIHQTTLSNDFMRDLIGCAMQSDDVIDLYLPILKRTIDKL